MASYYFSQERGESMLKLYKDLTISYFLVVFAGLILLSPILNIFVSGFITSILGFLWILLCATVFQQIATRRFNRIIFSANDTCRIEESLNHLFGFYKGIATSKIDLIVAIYICNSLLHFGKHDLSLKILSQYNPEILFKRKREVTYKYLYYNSLTACYDRLDRNEEALKAFEKSGELLNSPYFNKKLKADFEAKHKLGYLLLTNNGEHDEEILSLLEDELRKSKNLLSQVSCRFSIARVLIKCGRLEEAQEHILFIKENGGDTVYAKCAIQNDFSPNYINEINLESWKVKPIKTKTYKALVISIALIVLVVVLTLGVGILTAKTVYISDYDTATPIILKFDKNGNCLTWEMDSRIYYPSENELELQYSIYSRYLFLNDYKGCKVTLKEKHGIIDFDLMVDFRKTTNDIYDVVDVSTTEEDYIESNKNGQYEIIRYKEFLGIRVLDGFI